MSDDAAAPPEHDFRLLSDQPFGGSLDPLGFSVVADGLARLIVTSQTSAPFVLGIEAPWGTGKSTLMGMVAERLDEYESVQTVAFNAWTADEAGTLEGLVKTVLNELDESVVRNALRNERLKSMARIVTSIAGGVTGLSTLVDQLWSRISDDPSARNELRKLVGLAIDEWSKQNSGVGEGRLLCVFVDDLDRCSEAGVLAVFEAMKLYLNVPAIVFVVGYDERRIARMISERKGWADLGTAREFVEKFIQTTHQMDRLSEARATALVESLVEQSGTRRFFGDNEMRLLVDRNDRNPRRIKRFINAFVLRFGLDATWREFEPGTLIRAQLVVMYFPEFARLVVRREGDPIAEFREYKQAREALRRQDLNDGYEAVKAARARIGLTMPEPSMFDSPPYEEWLTDLEENTPIEFRPLVDDDEFVQLTGQLGEASDWTRLRDRLVNGVVTLAEADRAEFELRFPRLAGLRVLWVDDAHDENNMGLVQELQLAGVEVTLANSGIQAEDDLRAGEFDVLVSDIARGTDDEAGFVDLRRFRELGIAPPNTIFYAGRMTPARVSVMQQLGVGFTNDPAELPQMLSGFASDRRTVAVFVESYEGDRADQQRVAAVLRSVMPEAAITEQRAVDGVPLGDVAITVVGPTWLDRRPARSDRRELDTFADTGAPHFAVSASRLDAGTRAQLRELGWEVRHGLASYGSALAFASDLRAAVEDARRAHGLPF